MALFRDMGAAARKAARTEVGVKIFPAKARAALGLAPITETEKAAPKAGQAEKSK